MTLEELRCKRARDMLALIEQPRVPVRAARRSIARPDVTGDATGDATADATRDGTEASVDEDERIVGLHPCSARELEWLAPELALHESSTTRSDTAPHSAYGVASPFMPSLLVVIYTARYFLASRSRASAARGDVHIVYGALQAVELPYERGMGLDPR
jgi:hypothetical protein